MRRRLVVALVLLVGLPFGLLAWLGLRVARSEQQLVESRLRQLLEARLADVDAQVQRVLERHAQRLMSLTEDLDRRPEALRDLVRTEPDVEQVFVQASDGRLLFPPVAGELSRSELAFLVRTRAVFAERLLGHAAPQETPAPSARARTVQLQQVVVRPDHGWYGWYWETGLHLLFWRRDRAGDLLGAELSGARLLADIITEVQATAALAGPGGTSGSIALVDVGGRVLSRWGATPAAHAPVTRVEVPLSPPLGAWRLRAEHPGTLTSGGPLRFGVLAGLLSVAAAIGGLALYLYRESTRDLRDAAQRVSFVNQVSHELRTPLTNIRLYAELLEERLDDDDPTAREHLGVIVAECHRLSRLIGNVLSFARQHRGQLRLNPRLACLDAVVASVVDQFRPALARKEMAVEVEACVRTPFRFDPDAVEQVVANLLGNVEKYAAAGGLVRIETRSDAGRAWLRVADRGPGIPAHRAEAVFEPFVRLSDRVTEGVSGAGIGLSIARELARLHGGELRLVPSEQGACFELELPVTGRERETDG